MVHVTRRERFSAAHRLNNETWTDKKNEEVFGPCSNPLWHGHNYILWVTVKGAIHSETGYVCDLKVLGNLIKEKIINKVDHKNLNLEVDFLDKVIVSTENLAVKFWEQLEQPVRELGVELHSIKVEETENNYVEYFGN
jgi:6-pyruvoyltetrahydropterin/6-carboxytetrahydropterin synthase